MSSGGVSDTAAALPPSVVLVPLLASRDPRKQVRLAVGRAASHIASHTTDGNRVSPFVSYAPCCRHMRHYSSADIAVLAWF